MKFTLSWLKDHLDTQASVETIAETLTNIGLEVEGIDNPAKLLGGFSIAYVIEASPHPNADRLRVCMVDVGGPAPVQVVCGAPNARGGMKSVFSPPGTYIPGKNITLGSGVIRGVASDGMLCSSAELQLSEDHDGILDLPQDAPVGHSYAAWAGFDDPVFDVSLTPNRADATSVYGIARDLAAAGIGVLKPLNRQAIAPAFHGGAALTLDFSGEAGKFVPKFVLRLVRGVKNDASPEWLQKRLRAIGLRPISALVDITNYITFDLGRPLHVFDADKVAGSLVVRAAKAGETFFALDGRNYTLEEGMVVIADDHGVESLAGIMGGEATGCSADTVNVLIESALWDAAMISRTGRKLNIHSDARYRFERGVDTASCEYGIEAATRMVLELCGGTPGDVCVKVPEGYQAPAAAVIDFPLSEVARLTGLQLSNEDIIATLEKLGFVVAASSDAARRQVTVASWRPDVMLKADLVEEVVRMKGLDKVPSQPLPRLKAGVAKPILTLSQRRRAVAQRALAASGLIETMSWSFISREQAVLFGGGSQKLTLANPVSAELAHMRPSLLPGLLEAVKRNFARGLGDTALFEVGNVFFDDTDKGQGLAAAIVRKGSATRSGSGRHWGEKTPRTGLYDLKADTLGLLATLGIVTSGVQIVAGAPNWFHPGLSATLQFGPKNMVGAFGELHPAVAQAMGLDGSYAMMELRLDLLPAPKARANKIKARLELSDLMPLERDFAFLVPTAVAAADLIRAAQGADRQMIEKVSLFDVYEGTGVAEGHKSIALSVTLQPKEKTMTEAQIEAISVKIVAEVAKKTGAVLRQ